ncbi:MAG: SigB/SigF/SigG family RNA polymerase sigma factor [Solirubrobacteraceae bacterium]
MIGTDEKLVRCKTHGDQAARDELIRRYLPLARKLARRYAGAREPLDDLVQVASIGLVKAVDRFDPQRGIAFPAFAVPTILGELKRYFRDLGWSVHVPRGIQEMALQIGQATEQLTSRSGRAPSVTELAQYLEWSLEDVVDALEAASAHHAVPLDAPRQSGHDEPPSMLGRSLGAEDAGYELVDTRLTLAAAARLLPARDRRILWLRFVADLTQTQIADRIGISQMQVSRILRRALARLGELAVDGAPGPVR